MMTRDDFERWCSSKGVSSNYIGDGQFQSHSAQFAYEAWQACAEQYEAERNALLAVIEKQKEYLRSFIPLTADSNTWKEALALTPENVRLVEVGEVTIITYEDQIEQHVKINYLFENDGTKLYAIEVQP